ncbi:hypothetical protein SAMN04488144_14614 [Methylobacterium sp. 190mf]|nr:hypothetical protein SAMN04488144_14614 [Methylobacterium sp. 190mf]
MREILRVAELNAIEANFDGLTRIRSLKGVSDQVMNNLLQLRWLAADVGALC